MPHSVQWFQILSDSYQNRDKAANLLLFTARDRARSERCTIVNIRQKIKTSHDSNSFTIIITVYLFKPFFGDTLVIHLVFTIPCYILKTKSPFIGKFAVGFDVQYSTHVTSRCTGAEDLQNGGIRCSQFCYNIGGM